jgi:hypothetical protein
MRHVTRARPLPSLALLLPLALSPLGCAGTGPDDETAETLPEPEDEPDPLEVPTDAESLLPWLVAEPYLDWPSESAIHGSTGPHFGNVRTWVHPSLEASLEAGEPSHPAGVAAVKELYGAGQERRGWAVSVKRADDSAGGDGWYWYEWYDGGIVASGDGISLCTGCHAGGDDYVLTPFPLQ